jgi:hypothetical protein
VATIASLNSKLTLNTANFRTGLQSATRSVRDFAGNARSSVSSITGSIFNMRNLVAGIAAGATVALIKSQMDSIDATAKVSDAIGIQTEKLIGLRHASGLAGVGQEQLDKSLKKMVLNVADAQRGSGEAAAAFAELGLSAEQLATMTPDQQFSAIADGLAGVESQSQKAALSYKIFGREGVNLLNVLNLGSEGLAASQAEAEKLGLTFSRIDAAKVEEANDAITKVGERITALGQQLAIGLAPYVTAVANSLLDLGGDGQTMAERMTGGFEWVASAIAKTADYLELPKAAFYGLRSIVNYVLGGVVKSLGWVQDKITSLFETLIGYARKVQFLLPDAMVAALDAVDAAVKHSRAGADLADMFANNLLDAAKADGQAASAAANAFLDGANSKAIKDVFAGIKASAAANAQAIADGAKARMDASAGAFDDLEADAGKASKLADALAGIQTQLDRFGMSDVQIKLADLTELGATTEQLDAARAQLEKIKRLGDEQKRGEAIASTLEELESQVRTFGLSSEEKQLLDLEALGASEDQLARAKAAMESLRELQAEQDSRTAGGEQGALARVAAGSAEAQRLAYQAARGAAQRDDVPNKQLATQERMARTLESIDRKQGAGGEGEWEL